MIFQRALRRELTSTAGAVFTTLFTITITVMLIRVLGQAAKGRVDSGDVMALIGFSALGYLPIILILTGFISVLLVVTRSYRDSEMVVWFASGNSLLKWIGPVLSFGMPLVLLTGFLSFYATPWANRQSVEFRERFQQREDIARVSPGRFQESSSSNRVFFVEGVADDASKVKNVFVHTVKDGQTSIVVANEGTVQFDEKGEKFVLLQDGRRYDGTPSSPFFELMEFERYGIRVISKAMSLIGDRPSRAQSTGVLLKEPTPRNLGELLWRIALPVMGMLLMLMAIPLGFVNPRGGRSANLMIALFLFVFYSNMISVLQASVMRGRVSFLVGWWPMHLLALLGIATMFLWRLKMNSPYHPLVMWGAAKRAYLFKKAGA
ncbi:MAG: LPS export ABC transporter permease LptF [Burkholderiaceae bacterium]